MKIDAYSQSGELSHEVLEKTKYRLFMSHAFTGLPTLNLIMEQVEGILEKEGHLGLVFIKVDDGNRIEKAYGWQFYDFVILSIARALKNMVGRQLRGKDILAIGQEHDDTFLIFLSEKKSAGTLSQERLQSVAHRLQPVLEDEVNKALHDKLRTRIKIRMGSTMLHQNSKIRLERMLYRSIAKTYVDDKIERCGTTAERSARLLQIIRSHNIQPHFQSITDMKSGKIFGFEALVRGPQDSVYSDPRTLFAIAEVAGLITELDRLCISKSWDLARLLDKRQGIFLNIHPATILDPTFATMLDTDWAGADLSNVVLEFTERMKIDDFTQLRDNLKPFRERGVRIAIDNTRAGGASVELLTELKPEFMKIDLSVIHGMDRDPMRRRLVETMIQFTRPSGTGLIAEGVETQGEYDALRSLDIGLGQGYYFGRPEPAFRISSS